MGRPPASLAAPQVRLLVTGVLDVVVVAYDSADRIEACLRAARRAGPVGSVIVVDQGHDGSGAAARGLGAEVISDPTNPGFGAGQNRGLTASSAPFVLVLNPDAVMRAGVVDGALRLLESDPDVAAVQGLILSARTREVERSAGTAINARHLVGRAARANQLRRFRVVREMGRIVGFKDHIDRIPDGVIDVESLAATAVVFRRTALEDVGGFDPGFFLYGEDVDLCMRLRARGWRLVAVPWEWAVHGSGQSFAGSWERELHWWNGTMRYAARWFGPGQWAVALAASSFRSVTLALRRPGDAATVVRSLLVEQVRSRRELRRSTTSAPAPPSPTRSSRGRR